MMSGEMSPRARWARAQVELYLIEHPDGLRQPVTLALQRLDEIGAILTPERAAEIAAEARAAALNEAADAVARFTGNHLDANAKMLRRMAAAVRAAQTGGEGFPLRGGHDNPCAYAAGMGPTCTCSKRDGGEPEAPGTERSRWQAIADALNAVPALGIDLDGTLTDHLTWSVVWDRAAERWVVDAADERDAQTGGA